MLVDVLYLSFEMVRDGWIGGKVKSSYGKRTLLYLSIRRRIVFL